MNDAEDVRVARGVRADVAEMDARVGDLERGLQVAGERAEQSRLRIDALEAAVLRMEGLLTKAFVGTAASVRRNHTIASQRDLRVSFVGPRHPSQLSSPRWPSLSSCSQSESPQPWLEAEVSVDSSSSPRLGDEEDEEEEDRPLTEANLGTGGVLQRARSLGSLSRASSAPTSIQEPIGRNAGGSTAAWVPSPTPTKRATSSANVVGVTLSASNSSGFISRSMSASDVCYLGAEGPVCSIGTSFTSLVEETNEGDEATAVAPETTSSTAVDAKKKKASPGGHGLMGLSKSFHHGRSPFTSFRSKSARSPREKEESKAGDEETVSGGPTRSKSLRQRGAKLAKQHRLSWNASADDVQRSLSINVEEAGEGGGVDPWCVRPPSALSWLALKATGEAGGLKKSGQLELKRRHGGGVMKSSHRSCWCALTSDGLFFAFANSSSSGKDNEARLSWDLNWKPSHVLTQWVVKAVTSDGKELAAEGSVRSPRKSKSKHFLLLPPATAGQPPPTGRQFQAATKEEAASWIHFLSEACADRPSNGLHSPDTSRHLLPPSSDNADRSGLCVPVDPASHNGLLEEVVRYKEEHCTRPPIPHLPPSFSFPSPRARAMIDDDPTPLLEGCRPSSPAARQVCSDPALYTFFSRFSPSHPAGPPWTAPPADRRRW